MIRSMLCIALGTLALVGCGTESGAPIQSEPAAPSVFEFVDATEQSGVSFVHVAGRSAEKWMPEVMGSGVAVADFNRDGAPDILFVNSGDIRSAQRPSDAANALYLNNGKGQFTDVSEAWDLPSEGYGMGVAVGDYDNDGYVDVFLTHLGGDDLLLRNTGKRFINVTASAGLQPDGHWSMSAGFFDYDADGFLDLYLTRYLDFSILDAPKSYHNTVLIYPTPLLFSAVSDRFWRNTGDGSFADVSSAVGLDKAPRKGLALAIGDVDDNGTADVYVANDTSANQLWLTSTDGEWEETAQLSGTAYNDEGREEGSMGADFSDMDGNGLADIAVTNFQLEVTNIFRQEQSLLFTEVSDLVGVGRSSRARLSFGIDFFDANNNGWEDLLVANGHIEDNIHLNSDSVTFAQANSLYINHGDGSFADVSASSGDALDAIAVSRGLATADFNGDGALDFVVTNNHAPAQVGFNQSQTGNFVVLWLEGTQSNRSAIGARAVATVGDRVLRREVMGAQSYLSVSDFRLHFGLAAAEQIDELSIHWPSGAVQKLSAIEHGQFYHLLEGEMPVPFVPGQAVIAPR